MSAVQCQYEGSTRVRSDTLPGIRQFSRPRAINTTIHRRGAPLIKDQPVVT